MAFPIKGLLDGSEKIALYDESGGNVAITTADIAALAGVGTNGMFSTLNYWDGSVDGGLVPTTGIWTPTKTQPSGGFPGTEHGLFLNEDWVVHGSATVLGVEWAPATIPSIKFMGLDTFVVSTDSYGLGDPRTLISLSDANGIRLEATDAGTVGSPTLTLSNSATGIIRAHASSHELNIANDQIFIGQSIGGSPKAGFYQKGASQVVIVANSGSYYLGDETGGDLPNQDNAAPQLLALDTTDGRIVMRTPDSINDLGLPLSQANQNIPATTVRAITGPGDSDLTVSGFNSFAVTTTSASLTGTALSTLGISTSQVVSSPASIRLNNSNSSYILGDGSGGNSPPDTLVDTYLTLDSNGNIGRRTVVPGSGPNYFNTNLSLTNNRTHTGAGFALSFTGLLSLNYTATNSAFTLDSTVARILHNGGGAELADYRLGDGTTNTVMPDDPGGNLFLKYDEATGRVYKEDTILAADGNGMFDPGNNPGTWAVDRPTVPVDFQMVLDDFWYMTDDLVTPTVFFRFGTDVPSAAFQVGQVTGTPLASLLSLTSLVDAVKVAFSTNFTLQTDSTAHDLFQIKGSASNAIIQAHRVAPSLSLDILSTGQLHLSQYNGTLAEASPTSLLGVDGSGNVVPVAEADYNNSGKTISYAEMVGSAVGYGIGTGAQIEFPLSAGSSSGSFSANVASDQIDVTTDTFAEIFLDVVWVPNSTADTGVLEILINGSVATRATAPYDATSAKTEMFLTAKYMGLVSNTDVISGRFNFTTSTGTVNITHIRLTARD